MQRYLVPSSSDSDKITKKNADVEGDVTNKSSAIDSGRDNPHDKESSHIAT